MTKSLPSLKWLAIQCLLLMTFGLAGWAKWAPGGIPAGFQEQFGATFLAALPGGLFLPYYTIAVTETLAFFLALWSVFRREFLPNRSRPILRAALTLSLFIYVILGFGLRLTAQFPGAANLYMYFGVTLLALWMVERDEPQA